MIREDRFVLSRGQYAVSLDSMRTYPSEVSSSVTFCFQAAWYRKKGGVLRACLGELRHYAQGAGDAQLSTTGWLESFDDGRYGGDCEGRWDGSLYWGSEDPEVMIGHLQFLKPMLESYPLIPEGYSAWWRFPTTAEMRAKRGLA